MLLQIPCYHKLGISIVATYAPSTNVTAEEQQTYLDDLEALLTHVKARHILILAGDFNAEVGIRDQHTQVLGPHMAPANGTSGDKT
jgi:endonuclease/exonuclease/phosphatase (EEP) superfamily protein YafD